MCLSDKVVLITAGSSGIGASSALLFAKEGANVAIVGTNEIKLNRVAKECAKVGKKPLVIKADMTKDEDAVTIVPKVINTYGKLNVIVNNTGTIKLGFKSQNKFMDMYDQIMNSNLRPIVSLVSTAMHHIISSKGSIIVVLNGAKYNVNKQDFKTYCFSKSIMSNFVKNLAGDIAQTGVRVNAVSPGPMRTNLFELDGLLTIFYQQKYEQAVSKVSEAEKISQTIAYLASDEAKNVTGEIIELEKLPHRYTEAN